MDPRLEKLMKEIVNFLKEDLDEENISYECQLQKDCLIKKIQHIWNETKYDVSRYDFKYKLFKSIKLIIHLSGWSETIYSKDTFLISTSSSKLSSTIFAILQIWQTI